MPDADDLLAILQQACALVLGVDPSSVTCSSRFAEDLGADSLALVEIVEIVEARLAVLHGPGLRIEDEQLDGLRTVDEAVGLAAELLERRG